MHHFANVARGFLMGSADIVPGVSGGTVALVLGIYERLVHNIRGGAGVLGSVIRGRFAEAGDRFRTIEWPFLLALVAGIGIAIVSLARLLDSLLEDRPQAMAGLFFGLIAGSIVIASQRVRAWTRSLVGLAIAAAVAAFVVLGLRSGEVTSPSTMAFFGSGAVAIIAMILPGISGSFILLMIGMYEAVLDAVNDRQIGLLLVFTIGAVVGLASFSTVLDRLIRDHHDPVISVLVGIMAGSLRVLWPWPDGTDTARLGAPSDWAIPAALAVLGTVAVLTVGRYATHLGPDDVDVRP